MRRPPRFAIRIRLDAGMMSAFDNAACCTAAPRSTSAAAVRDPALLGRHDDRSHVAPAPGEPAQRGTFGRHIRASSSAGDVCGR
jgi:hypothetical protein